MYRTVIFDLDGTLLDTLDDLTTSVNFALASFSLLTRTREEIRSFVGNGIANLITRAIGYEHPHFSEVLQTFREYYGVHCKEKTKEYDGVTALLTELKARGVQTAVVSNKADFAVKKLAGEYFPDLLKEAVGENEAAGIAKKPAPDSLLTVMKNLNAEKETTVYIGDSEVDIQTANNAGVDCISVVWGFKDETFLKENGAKTLVKAPREILKFCDCAR
ncbi:MAG: HAD family hydrolase [Clostridia bacterium]|nr:HAD family hydrolase [Clostridia bacterium]